MLPRLAATIGFSIVLLIARPADASSFSLAGGVSENIGAGWSTVEEYLYPSGLLIPAVAILHDHNQTTTFEAFASSAAGKAGLGTLASATVANDGSLGGPFGTGASAVAAAAMLFDDFFIPGAAGSFQSTSFNVALDGTLLGSANASGIGTGQISVLFEVSGVNVGGGFQVLQGMGGGPSVTTSGVLTGWSGFGKVTSPSFNAPLGTPFTVKISLTSVASAVGAQNDTFAAAGAADFAHTLTFISGEPVFNLPAGMTIDSLDAGIIDNHYTVSATPPSSSPVPEPASLTLTGLGLAAAAYRRIRRTSATH